MISACNVMFNIGTGMENDYMNIVLTPNHYLIILDGVPHGELIPLHLPSFSAFIRPLKQ